MARNRPAGRSALTPSHGWQKRGPVHRLIERPLPRSRLGDLLNLLAEGLAEAAQMLGQDLLQALRPQLLQALKTQVQHLALTALAIQFRRCPQPLKLGQVELPLLTEEAKVKGLTILGAPLRPAATHPRYAQRDGVTRVPAHL